jgi:hypothetical protein
MGRLPTRERPWPHSLGTEAVRPSGRFPLRRPLGHFSYQQISRISCSWFIIRKETVRERTRGVEGVELRSTNCRKVALFTWPKGGAGAGMLSVVPER